MSDNKPLFIDKQIAPKPDEPPKSNPPKAEVLVTVFHKYTGGPKTLEAYKNGLIPGHPSL